MKRLFISILLFAGFMCSANAQNDAMFVYRNDGVINAFLKSDIDSLVCSQIDLDSILHTDYVVQEVWTIDSVYRIPLAVIDSVSFVTPPTVYKEGVTKMEEGLQHYVIGVDSLTLKLNSNTPSYLIPQKDDLLLQLENSEELPNGFAGKVEYVNTLSDCIEVVCEQTYIEDVFDSFCSVKTMVGYPDDNENASSKLSSSNANRAIYNPDDRVFNLGPYTLTASAELGQVVISDEDLALKGGASSSITVKPTFRIHTFLIVGESHGLYFNCSITGNLEVSSKTSVYGGLEWNHEYLNPDVNIPIPYTGGLINFYINPGRFIRANAMITSSVSDYRKYTFGMAYDFSSKGETAVKPSLGGRLVSSSTDLEGSLDGSVAWGTYMEMGFNLASKELARVCVRGEYGVKYSGNFVLRNSDIENADKETVLYERLKASSLERSPFVNASLISSVLLTQGSRTWELSEIENHWNLVPTFQNTSLTHTSGSTISADAYTELSGNCLFPVPVGYKLFDANMSEIADYNAPTSYTNEACCMEHCFESLSKNAKYTLYPKVKLFGYDILASPSAKLVNALPSITKFKVTKSEYEPGAFKNNGLYYDYKFKVALTVKIDTLEGVADWGYVYRDPLGNTYRISLMEYGNSYTDSRYAYYRNDAHSTVCFFTYVKYEGDSLYHYGRVQYYPLDYGIKMGLIQPVISFHSNGSQKCISGVPFTGQATNGNTLYIAGPYLPVIK